MDYIKTKFLFKVSKIARYISMYGFQRTYIKVRSQKHMARKFDVLPPSRSVRSAEHRFAIVGCGNYAYTTIAYFLSKNFGRRCIGSCLDVNIHRAASLARDYRIPHYTQNISEILDNPFIKLVFIASNHHSHAEYAIQSLRAGKSVYIEKPHVVNFDQLERLRSQALISPGKIFLGFNRPDSPIGKIIRSNLDKEQGPSMLNWFVAGHEIEKDHWYFEPKEGGRVLGNLCHWTDFILRCVKQESLPATVNATRGSNADNDFSVSYAFSDNSISTITFSAKGHVFDGVKESFRAHRGNCLITMDNFKHLLVENGSRRHRHNSWNHNHGHEENVVRSARNVLDNLPYEKEAQIRYIWETANLFLKTKESVESGLSVVAKSYSATFSQT